MEGEVKQTPAEEPKAGVRVTRKWEVRKFAHGYGCVLAEREGTGEPKDIRATGVFHADLTGRDVAAINAVCSRFGFSLERLVDECRMADSETIANRECARLSKELEDGNK